MKRLVTVVACASIIMTLASAAFAATLDDVRKRGTLNCGANGQLPGFGLPDAQGNWTGFDVDFCRAIAAAIFNDASKVKFTALTAKDRFVALQSSDVDVLARNTTWTMQRDTQFALKATATNYYDGQGFMVHRSRNVDSSLELDQARVCVQADTTTQAHLAGYFGSNNVKYQEKKFAKQEDVLKAYASDQCDVLTADVSQLYSLRLKLANPGEHVILPDVISKEPLAPVVRHKDDDWLLIVKWTLYAMVNAEELGVNSRNIGEALQSKKPEVMRLVGTEGTYGEAIGLAHDWAARIIRHVGNYGEVYDRNVGADSPLGIPRGLNQLWNAGGILYAPPIR